MGALTSQALTAAGVDMASSSTLNLRDAGSLSLNASNINAHGQQLSGGEQSYQAQQLNLAGSHINAKQLSLTATAGDINLSGSTLAIRNSLSASTGQGLDTSDAVITAQTLNLKAAKLNNTAGSLLQTGSDSLVLALMDGLDNAHGQIHTQGDLSLSSLYLDNQQGRISAGQGMSINSLGTINNQQGQLIANQRLDISASQINNQEGSIGSVYHSARVSNEDGSLIFSGGALRIGGALAIGGELDKQHQAQGKAEQLDNISANIEALGDVQIDAANLVNQRRTLQMKNVLISTKSDYYTECVNSPKCSYEMHIRPVTTIHEDQLTSTSPQAVMLFGGHGQLNIDSQGNSTAQTLEQIFNRDKVERSLKAQIEITQAFSQVAPKAVADFAEHKAQDLKSQANEAAKAGDQNKAEQLKQEAANWEEGGLYRTTLHTALGGLLTGDITGAASAGTIASLAPWLDQLQARVKEGLKNAGLSTINASTLAQAISELTAGAVGSVIGQSRGTGVAVAVDTNNRQLHWQEQKLIKQLGKQKAIEACKGDTTCINKLTLAWTDLFETVAEGLVDEEASIRNAKHLQRIIQTSLDSHSQGALGGVEEYLKAWNEALLTLSAYNTQAIQVNGNTVISTGSPQHYFNATESQRADRYINTFLGQEPSDLLPGKLLREAEFLGYLSTRNGEAEADYTLEENLLGGLAGNKVFKGLAQGWRALQVKLAGKVTASETGFISTQQVTMQNIEATLVEADRDMLATISPLTNTTKQGEIREIVMNNYFIRNGFTPLNGKCGVGCFDGVYVKGDKVYVVESKPLKENGSVQLNPAVKPDPASGYKGLPLQMTNDWIKDRAKYLSKSNVDNGENTGNMLLDLLEKNPSKIERILVASNREKMLIMKIGGN